MTIKDESTEQFLIGLQEIQPILLEMSFGQYSLLKKGFAYYARFRKDEVVVEFIFGPPDYHLYMIIYTKQGKFSFGDLLQIPTVLEWVNNNRYMQSDKANIENELFWFVELLTFSLKIIE